MNRKFMLYGYIIKKRRKKEKKHIQRNMIDVILKMTTDSELNMENEMLLLKNMGL